MVEEIAFENGRISNSEGLVTLTLDRVILHTVVHHSLTSTYMPRFIEIEENFVDEWTYAYVGTYAHINEWTFETGFIRPNSTLRMAIMAPPGKYHYSCYILSITT